MTLAKICGVTTEKDAHDVAAAGADFIGLNLWPKSKRHVDASLAARLAAAARSRRPQLQIVGVFVNPTRDELRSAIAVASLDWVQLHGDEPPEACVGLGVPVIKAFRLASVADLAAIGAYQVDAILIDAPQADYGGGGLSGDWSLARQAARLHPRAFVAGGLTPDNVARAIAATEPFAVDVASGVESAPGQKDNGLVVSFVERAHAASSTPSSSAQVTPREVS